MSVQVDWSKPTQVDDLLLVFPGSVAHLMPPRDECEAALDALPNAGAEWREFQRRWFFRGLPGGTIVTSKPGIDPDDAIRHLKCIQGSFEPKHEHKEAAVAYLASLWFEEPPSAGAGV